MISNYDLNELQRMVTNLYDDDKAILNRVIKGISALVSENSKLKAELARLKVEVKP